MSSSNTWTKTDNDEIITKLALLENLENEYREKVSIVVNIMRNLDKLNQDDPKDIDGSNLSDTRRMELKTSLITKSNTLLSE